LLWLARSGGQWHDLPEFYGSYAALKICYYQWIAKEIFQMLLEGVAAAPDLEWLMIDGYTYSRSHSSSGSAA